METKFTCSNCRNLIRVANQFLGSVVACPICGIQIQTPAPIMATAVAVMPPPTASKPNNLMKWIKRGMEALVDPDRAKRFEFYTANLQRELAQKKHSFVFSVAVHQLNIPATEMNEVAEEVYKRVLAKRWEDEQITAEERSVLEFVIAKLQISPQRAAQLNHEMGLQIFQKAITDAMADGMVDAREHARLTNIAAGMNTTVGQLVRAYFGSQSAALLRALFDAVTNDGMLLEQEWRQLLQTAAYLGIRSEELTNEIAPQARAFVEAVLADAKSDTHISAVEEQTIAWLLTQLRLPRDFCDYVMAQVNEVKQIMNAQAGHLPSLPTPRNTELRSGEVTHWTGPAILTIERTTQRGTRENQHVGDAIITDSRLIFTSSTLTHSLNHRKVLGLENDMYGVAVRSESRGGGTYHFRNQNYLAFVIFQAAVRRANQIIVDKVEGQPTRHIPRDVRQRVWQRYGGRCAECRSDQYLEFDHIIPHSRGGSNADTNVQLLCRGCNLKKSDHI